MTSSALWQHPGFRRLYLSSASFVIGTQVYQLALPLIFYELTRSVSVMTGLRAIELLPNLLLAMFIGVWVDRIDRGRWARRAMVGMVLLLGLQAALLSGGASLLPLFLCSTFLLMTLNYLYAICRMGLVKEMLPERLLLPATGQLTVVSQVAAVIGPAIAGLLVSWQLAMGVWVPMLALLLAALLLRGLTLSERPFVAAGYWQDWREGLRVLRSNTPLWQLSWLVVLINISAGVVDVLFLFRARDELQLGPGTIGLVYAVAGLGGIAGGALCSRLRGRIGLGRLMVTSLGVETLCIVALAWTTALVPLIAALTLYSGATVIGNVCVWGYRQESTDSAFIGRVSGLTGSLFKLGMPMTLWLSGRLAGDQPLGLLLMACAGLHVVALLGMRCSAVYRVR